MFSRWVRKVVVSLLVLFQLWSIYVTFHYPVLSIVTEQNDRGQWVITGFDNPDIQKQFGLDVGDVIMSVNGSDPGNHWSIQRWRSIQQADSFVIEHNGQAVQIKAGQVVNGANNYVVPLVSELLCLLLAFLLTRKASQSPSARLLSLVFMTITVIFMSLGASGRGDMLGKIVMSASMMTLPVVFLHFFLVFFNEKGDIPLSTRIVRPLYAVPALCFFLSLLYFTPLNTYPFYRVYVTLIGFYFVAGVLINLYVLAATYWKYRQRNDYIKMVIKTVWAGLVFAFTPFAVLSMLPQILIHRNWLNPLYSSWFIVLFPLSFAYLILAKRLYDLDVILRRMLFTLVIAVVPALLILVGQAVATQRLSTGQLTTVFLYSLLVIAALLYSLEYILKKLQPVMFPRKHALDVALHKISSNLPAMQNFRELKTIVLEDIVESIDVTGAGIVFQYDKGSEIIGVGKLDEAEIKRALAADEKSDEYTFMEINCHEEYRSVLVVANKRNVTWLNQDEIQWLNLVISYLQVSLENVYLIQKLTINLHELAAGIPNDSSAHDLVWLRKAMFELQERERFRIATDLHDTTMQDLFLLKRSIHNFMLERTRDQRETEQLERFIRHLEIINETLRDNCFELNPHLLQHSGLVDAIQKWIEFERSDEEWDVQFTVEQSEEVESVGLETKKHLFRLVQEMLSNAKKHAHASLIQLRLYPEDGLLHLYYRDDGIGFDLTSPGQDERLRKAYGSGLGLMQMRSRIHLLNGTIEVETAPGQGTRIHAAVPLDEAVEESNSLPLHNSI